LTGIGDDCAVLRSRRGYDTLVTTDFSLENIHFRRDWHSPESVGHRCLARGLSDIAAMGGEPAAAFLSLALPAELPQTWVDGFIRGFSGLAKQFDVTLAGGDTAQSPGGILADIIVVGSVPKGKAVLRSGARVGDGIYITGDLGGSAATLAQMMRSPRRKLDPKDYGRHFFPEPRMALGRMLREKRWASAMIDTSDGLSTDLGHVCQESGVGAEIEAEAIPRASIGKARAHKTVRAVELKFALHGGEDYELLFTARRETRVPKLLGGIAVTKIGEITRGTKIFLIDQNNKKSELKPEGWEHFQP
jgi:thiamine-monophosphate kinase